MEEREPRREPAEPTGADVPEAALRVREALDATDEVDAERIDVVARGDRIVLRGWVATGTEAMTAEEIATGSVETTRPVVNELQVDPGLREGIEEPAPREPAEPPENEVLVGGPDMLAGPEAAIETEMDQALAENEPWEPPDAPAFAAEEAEAWTLPEAEDEPELVLEPPEEAPSPTDLDHGAIASAAEGRTVPSLDPTANPPRPEPTPEPLGRSELGDAPTEEEVGSTMPEPVPGTEKGPGAVGEHATGGGTIGSEPAFETGAKGADTRHADPARSATGNVDKVAGTHRGPETDEDPGLREDFPEED